jgi:hypothetical protein
MITEHAILDVRPGREREFESAFAKAKPIIAGMPGFRTSAPLRAANALAPGGGAHEPPPLRRSWAQQPKQSSGLFPAMTVRVRTRPFVV